MFSPQPAHTQKCRLSLGLTLPSHHMHGPPPGEALSYRLTARKDCLYIHLQLKSTLVTFGGQPSLPLMKTRKQGQVRVRACGSRPSSESGGETGEGEVVNRGLGGGCSKWEDSFKHITGKIQTKQKVSKEGGKMPPTLLCLGDVCIAHPDRKSCPISVREKQRLCRRKDRTFLLGF